MHSTPWPAPAKINRFLHITGRREDGYHLLQTVFQFLDYSDLIYLDVRDDGQIVRETEVAGIPEKDDLMVRAASLLQEHAKIQSGVTIRIEKKLPMGGGLGGGSSDAATVLVALNQLWGAGLDKEALSSLGLFLGADVPIFVHAHAAWAEGVGEEIQPVDLDEPWFLVVVPDVHVSTREVFCHPELTRDTTPIKIADFLAGAGQNDCEDLVCNLYERVGKTMEWMKQHADHADGNVVKSRMTGTGACIFAGFENEHQARFVQQSLPQAWYSFIARGLNCSPLQERLAQER